MKKTPCAHCYVQVADGCTNRCIYCGRAQRITLRRMVPTTAANTPTPATKD